MTEFVTHKVQITAIDGRSSQQSDHLVKGNTAVNDIIFISLLEVPVHVGVNQTEDNGFVSHKCLIMAFAVGNSLFILAAVGYFPEQA